MSKKVRSTFSLEHNPIDPHDNNLVVALYGPQDENIRQIENDVGVHIQVRGSDVSIHGEAEAVELAQKVMGQLYGLLKKGYTVSKHDVAQSVKILKEDQEATLQEVFLESLYIPQRKKAINPRTQGQKQYINAIKQHDLVFGVGPAGTGKTYLAIAMAISAFLQGDVKKIILTRPAIEAGEKLGFLPGDLVEKVNPYLRPLYDAMHDILDFERTQKMLERGEIEVAPLAFMRGRTLADAFVILDEAQNCTREQMKMFLTRFGLNSKVVITGDVTQIDLPREKDSGLIHALKVLRNVDSIHFQFLTTNDIVRHRLVQEIVEAYDREKARLQAAADQKREGTEEAKIDYEKDRPSPEKKTDSPLG